MLISDFCILFWGNFRIMLTFAQAMTAILYNHMEKSKMGLSLAETKIAFTSSKKVGIEVKLILN